MNLSSPFFSNKWHLLVGENINPYERALINGKMQPLVEEMINGEETFWNIDFSENRITLIQNKLNLIINNELRELKLIVESIINMYSEDEGYIQLSSMLLGLLSRIKQDKNFCQEYFLKNEFIDLCHLCFDEIYYDELDIPDLYDNWDASNDPWDSFLRSLTPDLPDYICDDFVVVYNTHRKLPAFFIKFKELVNSKQYSEYTLQLKNLLLTVEDYKDSEIEKIIHLFPS